MTSIEVLAPITTPSGALVPEAPKDGKVYGRKDGIWAEAGSGGGPGGGGGVIGTARFSASGGAVSNLVLGGCITDVVRTAKGFFKVTLKDQPDSNYNVSAIASDDDVAATISYIAHKPADFTATGFSLVCYGFNPTDVRDPGVVSLTIMRVGSGGGGAGLPDITGQEGKVLGVKDAKVQWVSGGAGAQPANKYKRVVTVPASSGPAPCTANFTATKCQGDGVDIRVYEADANDKPTGDPVPRVIFSVTATNPPTFTVLWKVNTLEPKKYVITYGDMSASDPKYTTAQLIDLLPYLPTGAFIASVSTSPSNAYVPPVDDWGKVGTLVGNATMVDQGVWDIDPPVPSTWVGETVTKFRVGSNSVHELSTPTRSATLASGSYDITGPDGFACNPGDMEMHWCRQVTLPDGWALHYECALWGNRANSLIKCTIRYQTGGVWTYTWFDSKEIPAPYTIKIRVNNSTLTNPTTTAPTLADPASYLVYQIRARLMGTVGDELPL